MELLNDSDLGIIVQSALSRVYFDMAIYLGWGFGLGLAGVLGVGGAIAYSAGSALAQITPDATLGAEGSVVTPNVNIRGFPTDRIDGGATRGTNLFHSFQEFNVGNGQRVYFANPTGIENILTRITGNKLSNILGTLGVDGGANLFLLNPNGIIFGSNSQLDIASSFVASTANSVVFDNGFVFSANNPEAPPLLSIKVPLGVQYGSNQATATIVNTGNLTVGQNLTLNAGNLDLQGQLQAGKDLTLQAQDTVKIRDNATTPFAASAGGRLLVQGNQRVDIFALNHPNSGLSSGGDMVLRSGNTVGGDAHYWSGGNFRIEQLDGSLGNLESPNDPIILANGNVTLGNYRGASLHILAGGSVSLDNIEIISPDSITNTINPENPDPFLASLARFKLSDGTDITIDGRTPTVDIRSGIDWTRFPGGVPQLPTIIGGAIIPQPIFGGATSADITVARNIRISQSNGLVLLTNQYQPNSLPGKIQVRIIRTDDAIGGFSGNSSPVIIDSRGDIEISRAGLIRTSSATGNAGNISLIGNGSFFVTNGGLSTRTQGLGNAGNVNIKVRGAVSLADSSFILTFAGSNTGGNSGNINIQSSSLSLTNGSQLQTSVNQGGRGKAGNVDINVLGTVTLSGIDSQGIPSGIFTGVNSGTIGNAGNITVQAGSLFLRDAAEFQANTSGRGNAGTINVGVAGSVLLANGGRIESSVNSGSAGNGGMIEITAKTVDITGSGQVLTGSGGTENAGDLFITATDSVNVNSQGLVTTSSIGAVNSGNLTIKTREFNLSDPVSIVTTNSFGTGKSGDLLITNADAVTVSNQGFLSTNSSGSGNGGKLSIRTRQLDVKDGGLVVTSTTGTGTSGDLSITATDSINIVNQSYLSASPLDRGTAGNTFIETGKLSIRDRSGITSSTLGARNAGNLTVRATNSIEVVNSSKLSADTLGSGNGGNLNVETNTLSIRDSEISTGTLRGSSGKGGTLRVNADDAVEISGVGGLVTATLGQGKGGDIQLSANSLSLSNGGSITSLSDGQDKAGNIAINLRGSLRSSGGNISASSLGAGGGDINITADDIRLRDSSLISTSVFDSTGGGGNITINSKVFLALEDSDILANAQAGPGGNITINSSGFIADLFSSGAAVAVGRNPGDLGRFRGNGQNDISVSLAASSRNNSRVDISTASATGPNGISNYSYRDPTQGAASLPSNLVDASELIDRRCSPNSSAKKSSFTITGRGGLPPGPNGPLTNQDVMVNWIILEEGAENNNGTATEAKPSSSHSQQLVEAQSWVIGSDGQVILTAAVPSVTPGTSGLTSPSCEDNQAATQ